MIQKIELKIIVWSFYEAKVSLGIGALFGEIAVFGVEVFWGVKFTEVAVSGVVEDCHNSTSWMLSAVFDNCW